MRQASIKTQMLSAVYIPSIMFLSSVATALVLTRGGYLSMQGLMEIGTLSAFTSYSVGIFEPIQQIARILADIISAQANIERVCGLLEEVPAIEDAPDVVEKYGDNFVGKTENWEPIRGDIEFRDVTFRYPDGNENILEHFNLKIPAGTTVAIVGETGAGKSTLVNLACRFSSQRKEPSSLMAGITGSGPSCGCTVISVTCCKTPICFPAVSKKIFDMAG